MARKMGWLSVLVLAFGAMWGSHASAQTPTSQMIPFGGTAPGQAGLTPDLTFTLVDAAGMFLGYRDCHLAVAVDANEQFGAVLGAGKDPACPTPAGSPVPPGIFAANSSVFIAIELTGTPGEIARVPVQSQGYAHVAHTLGPGATVAGGIRVEGGYSQSSAENFDVDAPDVPGGRFRIAPNGNVGIGTITPGAKLHVSAPTGTGVFGGTTDGIAVHGIGAVGGQFETGNGFILIGRGQGSDRFAVDSLGNITARGILSVVTPTTSAGDNTANFRAPAIGPNFSHIHWGSTGDWFIRSASAAGRVILQDSGGNVGIGTANPVERLHVAGSFLRVDGAGNEQAYIGGDGVANDVQVGSFNQGVDTVVLFNATAGSLMDLRARTVFQTSTVREKKDVERLDQADYDQALQKLTTLDVVRFRYTGEPDGRQPHLGVLAEEAPEEILNPTRDSISLASYTSLLLAALKAQQAEIEALKKKLSEVEALKAQVSEIAALKARPRQWQGLIQTRHAQDSRQATAEGVPREGDETVRLAQER